MSSSAASHPSPRAEPARLVLLLGALTAIMPFTMDSYLPAMPAIQAHFGASVAEVQLTLTLFIAGMAFGQLLYGPASDRFGRRGPLLSGLACFVAASAACAVADSIALLAPLRFLQGLSLSCAPIIGRAVARDLFAHEKAARLLSRMQVLSGLAPVMAPAIGALLLHWLGWRSVLWLVALCGAALLAAVALRLPETAPAARSSIRPARIAANFRQLLRAPAFLAPLALLCMNQIGLFAFLTSASFVVVRAWGHSPIAFGLLFSFVMTGQILGAHFGGRIAARHGIPRAVALGAAVSLASGVMITALAWGGVTHLAAIGIPMFLFMTATGVVFPNAVALGLSPFPALAGSASSLMAFTPVLCGALTGGVLALLFDNSSRPMAGAVGVAALGVFACERLLIRRMKRH